MSSSVAQAGADLAAFARYARGLRGYISDRLDDEEARRRVVERLGRREENFVRLLEERIFAVPSSPYRPLFDHAGLELGDAVRLAREEGVEGALGRFYDTGVYVSLDEFKGRRPIQRGSLVLDVTSEDFDNPSTRRVMSGSSSGSRGPARRTKIDFRHMEDNAVYTPISLRAEGIAGRPYAIWRPVPPGQAGLNGAITHAKAGKIVDRWFTQYPLSRQPEERARVRAHTLRAGREPASGHPDPEAGVRTPRTGEVIARWLAEQCAAGTPRTAERVRELGRSRLPGRAGRQGSTSPARSSASAASRSRRARPGSSPKPGARCTAATR